MQQFALKHLQIGNKTIHSHNTLKANKEKLANMR